MDNIERKEKKVPPHCKKCKVTSIDNFRQLHLFPTVKKYYSLTFFLHFNPSPFLPKKMMIALSPVWF